MNCSDGVMKCLKEKVCECKTNDKKISFVKIVLCVIGVLAAIGGVIFAIYKLMEPDPLDEFDDEFDDEFENDLFEDDDDVEPEQDNQTEEPCCDEGESEK